MTASNEAPTILLATANPHKIEELKALFGEAGIDARLVSLLDFPHLRLPEENGRTFEENAAKKASAMAEETGLVSVADDSGLEVAALGGDPGVRSKRFAGDAADDAQRYHKLLSLMQDVPDEQREARFRCCIAIVVPSRAPVVIEGICEGHIARSPQGSHGFGYDPVFIPQGFDCTMAQLTMEEKNRISHRGKALEAALPKLRELLSDLGDSR